MKTMTYAKYLSVYVTLGFLIAAIYQGGLWVFSSTVFIFAFVPLVELFDKGTTLNFSEDQEKEFVNDWMFDVIVYLSVPLQYTMVLLYLFRVKEGGFVWWEFLGLTWATGIACGVFGINVGHELGHRKTWYEQLMAKMLLLTSLYTHFFVEHNHGHHARVATPDDPATARYRESVYAFWVRSIRDSYKSAWNIEGRRLRKRGKKVFSWQNQMVRFTVYQVAALLAILVFFGPLAMVGFVGAALSGALLLETVNYIEHYGLMREKKENGRYAPVTHEHSWNANHSIGRAMLFDLTRHADHHAHATRKYQVLRHFDDSPQLPTGYPGMLMLAMVPPLYFKVMDKAMEDWKQEKARQEAAMQAEGATA